jgi:hypothetical protein
MAQVPPVSVEFSNAQIFLWQGKFRRVFVLLFGFGTISLKWSGAINADSVVSRSVGVHGALLIAAGVMVAYLAFVEVTTRILARRGVAPQDTVIVAVVADMAMLFSVVYLVTPPPEYSRALIIAIFPVQFTQLYFGQRATMYSIACVAVATRYRPGGGDRGVLHSPSVLGPRCSSLGRRSSSCSRAHRETAQRIVQLFERAQDGDFSMGTTPAWRDAGRAHRGQALQQAAPPSRDDRAHRSAQRLLQPPGLRPACRA